MIATYVQLTISWSLSKSEVGPMTRACVTRPSPLVGRVWAWPYKDVSIPSLKVYHWSTNCSRGGHSHMHSSNSYDWSQEILTVTLLLGLSLSICKCMCMSHKLPPTLHRQPLNEAWVRAGGCKQSLPRYPQGQSRTCYQECGCHSVYMQNICSICLLNTVSVFATYYNI